MARLEGTQERAGPLGIMAAMPEEIDALAAEIHAPLVHEVGRRRFLAGSLHGREVVCVHSRCGKVAAATTAAELVRRFDVPAIVMTGLAGGLADGLAIGDVVVATELAQHDLDASPVFPALEVPLLGQSWFEADVALADRLERAASEFLESDLAGAIGEAERSRLHVRTPKVVRGAIVSGDQFIGSDEQRGAVLARTPPAVCVEMEGAAVAQVAWEHGVPFAVVRAISDTSDDHAAAHFPESLCTLAGAYARGILGRFLGFGDGDPRP